MKGELFFIEVDYTDTFSHAHDPRNASGTELRRVLALTEEDAIRAAVEDVTECFDGNPRIAVKKTGTSCAVPADADPNDYDLIAESFDVDEDVTDADYEEAAS